MRRRDILIAVLGIFAGFGMLALYGMIRSHAGGDDTGLFRPTDLNDELSRQRLNAIVLAANRVGPAVVSITVVQTRVVSVSPFGDDVFGDFFQDFFPEQRYRQKVKSLGSGVIISRDGYVLTNEHVITNATEIKVTLSDGRQFDASVIAEDRTMDLALIRIAATGLPFAELGDSDGLMIGEWVIALGNPFGFLLEDASPTVTVGVISALKRAIKSTHDDRVYKEMIQTDAAINPGNSGGPLVNVTGQVIGINTFIFTSSGGSEGIGFARPINFVRRFIDEAQQHGHVREPWIGMVVQDMGAEGESPNGIAVARIDKASPAAHAGVCAGDRIISVNGVPVRSAASFEVLAASVFVGDTLRLAIRRATDSVSVDIVVGEYRPDATSIGRFGMVVEDINDAVARRYRLGYTLGVVVTRVDRDGAAGRIGICPGDVILQVGDMRIRSRDDLLRALDGERRSPLILDRGGLIIQMRVGV